MSKNTWANMVGTKPKIKLDTSESKSHQTLPSGVYLVKGGYFTHYDRQNNRDYWDNSDTPPDDGMTCQYISTPVGQITEKDRIKDVSNIVRMVTKSIYDPYTKTHRNCVFKEFIQPDGYSYEKAYWGDLFGKITRHN